MIHDDDDRARNSSIRDSLTEAMRGMMSLETQHVRDAWMGWLNVIGAQRLSDAELKMAVERLDVEQLAPDLPKLLGALSDRRVVVEVAKRIDLLSTKMSDQEADVCSDLSVGAVVDKETSWWIHSLSPKRGHQGGFERLNDAEEMDRGDAYWIIQTLCDLSVIRPDSLFPTTALGDLGTLRDVAIAFHWPKGLVTLLTDPLDLPDPRNPPNSHERLAVAIAMNMAGLPAGVHPPSGAVEIWRHLRCDWTKIYDIPEEWRERWGLSLDEPVSIGVVVNAILGTVHQAASAFPSACTQEIGEALAQDNQVDRHIRQLARAIAFSATRPIEKAASAPLKHMMAAASDQGRRDALMATITHHLKAPGLMWKAMGRWGGLQRVIHDEADIHAILEHMVCAFPFCRDKKEPRSMLDHYGAESWWAHKDQYPKLCAGWFQDEQKHLVQKHMEELEAVLQAAKKTPSYAAISEETTANRLTVALFDIHKWQPGFSSKPKKM